MVTRVSERKRPERRVWIGAVALASLIAIVGAAVPLRDGSEPGAVAVGRAIAGRTMRPATVPSASTPRVKPSMKAAPAASAARAPAAPVVPAPRSPARAADRARAAASAALPVAGKGMWIWHYGRIAGGDHDAIVRHAVNMGLTHLYVRAGSGYSGLDTLPQVAPLIPVAHRAGLKVIAWYFPYYNDIGADVARSVQTMRVRVEGQGFDAFAADIEPAKGAAFSHATTTEYSRRLREALPHEYLIAVPPRPTKTTIAGFPYAGIVPHYDAVAPMVYWGAYDPAETVIEAMAYLSRFGKPVAPIGQTYDMRSEGGPSGNPPPHQTWAFMRAAKARGAAGVSFWSWQHATSPEIDAIRRFGW